MERVRGASPHVAREPRVASEPARAMAEDEARFDYVWYGRVPHHSPPVVRRASPSPSRTPPATRRDSRSPPVRTADDTATPDDASPVAVRWTARMTTGGRAGRAPRRAFGREPSPPRSLTFGSATPFAPSPLPTPLEEMMPARTSMKRSLGQKSPRVVQCTEQAFSPQR